MPFLLRQFLRGLTACLLITIFAVPQSLLAQAHVVSRAELQRSLVGVGQTRQQNLQSLQRLMSSPMADKAMASLHTSSSQMIAAVSSLNDQELARLSARASKAQSDFAAGNINDHDLLIILVVILAIILIIVAVRH